MDSNSQALDSQRRKQEAGADHEINFAGGQKVLMNEEAATYVASHIAN